MTVVLNEINVPVDIAKINDIISTPFPSHITDFTDDALLHWFGINAVSPEMNFLDELNLNNNGSDSIEMSVDITDYIKSISSSIDFEFEKNYFIITLISKKGNDKHIPLMISSIKENGLQHALGCYVSGNSVMQTNGHHRLIAALYLGIQQIQVVVDFPSEDECPYTNEVACEIEFNRNCPVHGNQDTFRVLSGWVNFDSTGGHNWDDDDFNEAKNILTPDSSAQEVMHLLTREYGVAKVDAFLAKAGM